MWLICKNIMEGHAMDGKYLKELLLTESDIFLGLRC
jgi:hypothetical protein